MLYKTIYFLLKSIVSILYEMKDKKGTENLILSKDENDDESTEVFLV